MVVIDRGSVSTTADELEQLVALDLRATATPVAAHGRGPRAPRGALDRGRCDPTSRWCRRRGEWRAEGIAFAVAGFVQIILGGLFFYAAVADGTARLVHRQRGVHRCVGHHPHLGLAMGPELGRVGVGRVRRRHLHLSALKSQLGHKVDLASEDEIERLFEDCDPGPSAARRMLRAGRHHRRQHRCAAARLSGRRRSRHANPHGGTAIRAFDGEGLARPLQHARLRPLVQADGVGVVERLQAERPAPVRGRTGASRFGRFDRNTPPLQ